MVHVRYTIEQEGIPIGFFPEKKDAIEALTKYCKTGIISQRELPSYRCYIVEENDPQFGMLVSRG